LQKRFNRCNNLLIKTPKGRAGIDEIRGGVVNIEGGGV
jgi:hypothetical protein